MPLSDTIHRALLSAEERSSIAEIEATTNILQLVTRMTGTRFAAIAKFTETEWIVCSAYDPIELGIHTGDTLELETTLCSEFRRDPQVLFVPKISKDGRFATRPVVKQYMIESYAGAPIFLPDGQLWGALCALDSRAVIFDDPDLADTLGLFARLIGCIFYSNLTEAGSGYGKAGSGVMD
ncbi:GAF domain-containing protein [Pseudomonas sp. SWRI111]|uniref:GAF domain-containing protein n=1 Tax=Pseudomonas sp. SWRI111 TaxID=2745507 RepID=UPI001644101F|nr:GAF domain-containing protein [Pseudomonas sp. SWRI111]MBC3209335.1 GAF domain-containing protein [Pseudomonas sp. SWRI111]